MNKIFTFAHQHVDFLTTSYAKQVEQSWQRLLTTALIFVNAILLLFAAIGYAISFWATGSRPAATYTLAFTVTKIAATTLLILDYKKIIKSGGLVLICMYLLLGTALGQYSQLSIPTIVTLGMATLLTALLYGFWCSLISTAFATILALRFWSHSLQATMHFHDMSNVTIGFRSLWLPILFFYICTIAGGVIHHILYARHQVYRKLHATQPILPPNGLFTHDLFIDISKRQVWRGKVEILLRRKEYDILEYLARNKGKVVTKVQLFENIWHKEVQTESLAVHIKHLRDKVDRPFNESLIETLHGVGYTLKDLPIVAYQ